MRSLLVVLAAGLALAPAAHAKTGWEADRDWQTLVPGQRTNVVLTAIDHVSGSARFQGAVPTLQFERLSTGEIYEFRGAPADRRGRSTVAVTVPMGGAFQISVLVDGRNEGGWPPVDIKGAPKQAAAPPASDDDGGPSPGLLVAGVLVALLATGMTVATRRRPRMGGA